MADILFYIAPACSYFKNGGKIFGATLRKNVIDEYDLKRNRKKITLYFATDSCSKLNEVYGTRLDSDVVHKKRSSRYHESKIYNYIKSQGALSTDNRKSNTFKNKLRTIQKICSVPSFNTNDSEIKLTVNSKSKSCHQISIDPTGETNLVVNTMLNCPNSICFCTNTNPYSKFKYKVYRCQLNTQEESCCCSCNSDAMFEVMKSLYDCYKKKNCDNCNCILCGHLPREERRLGELRKLGKSLAEKEKMYKEMALAGTPLPEGRTPSEKALIEKIKTSVSPKARIPSEKLREAKAAGLLTPLEGKSKKRKERILRGLAMQGLPLPEAKTASDQKLIDRVRAEVGLPPEPKTPSTKEKYDRAMAAGIIIPLEGKPISEKEKILREQAKMGLTLPEGRTPSEKALIAKIKETVRPEKEVRIPSEKLRKAKAAGLLTPLAGKSKEQKEKILRGLAMQGIPLPEAKTSSEQKLMDQVRAEVGLPPEPKTPSAKEKYNRAMAAGLITPLEGKPIGEKEKILREQAKMGLPLPEGRTPSEKALIAKIKETVRPEQEVRIPSEKLRKAKAAGLLTPLAGKSKEQKEKILRGLALQGIPLPEAKTSSEQKLIDQIRTEVGLPPEPKTPSAKEKYNRAMAAGLITPLEGKSIGKKERILRDQAKMGLPLPEGRTPSEKALIAKIKESIRPESVVRVPSEKLRKAKAAGLLTPLEGKSKEQKEKILKGLAMQGIPLPEAKTASDQKLMDRVRAEVGLPPEPKTPSAKEKYNRAMAAGLITPLEGKSIGKKERILRDQAKMGLLLPEGRTPSEKALIAKIKETVRPEKEVRIPSEKLRKAKAAGLLTPLAGKPKEQKEKILRGLAMQGIPLPEAETASEQKLMDQVRAEVGLPPEPKTPSAKEKYNRAMAAGLITPLEGKSASKKEEILRGQAKLGLPLPEGRTASEKALIAKVKATTKPITEMPFGRPALPPEKLRKLDAQTAKIMKEKKGPSDECICDLLTPESERKPFVIKPYKIPSEKLRKAKAAGLLTPLEGKSKEQKEKILKGLAMQGIPLPEAKTASEQKIMDRVRAEVGLPPEPKTSSAKEKYNRAMAAGLITPLEGKSIGKKERILRDQAKMGLPLPEGRTPSEKALIARIKETTRPESVVRVPSEKLRKAKAAGLLTPLQGKSREQKQKILRGLAMQGIPLPEAKTASEQKLMDQVRAEVGLPPEPKTPSAKEKYNRAMAAGLITPLEGKSIGKKERILRDQAKMGLPLPEGRTPSEKALIARIKETTRPESVVRVPSEKLRKAKAAGLLTPLQGKSREQKQKILRGLAMQGIPLPEAKTASEQKLMDQVRAEVGLPPEPKTPSVKEKYNRAMAAGLITPLEGKSIGKKERILRDQAKMGLPLPEGRTPSEKALIARIKETTRPESVVRVPSEKLRKAKAAGLLTPLQGKSREQKQKILRGLAMQGIPLPEAKTASEQKLMDQVRAEVGLPPEPKTPSAKEKYNRAMAAGLITPLEGKSIGKKERILRDQAKMGLPLPEGRTPSEKALIAQIKETVRPESVVRVPSEKLRKARAAGLLTPLAGKSKEQKEKILRGLAMQGIPLPEAKTASEQKLMDRIRAEAGLPPEPKTTSAREKYKRAMSAGLITPLEGKSASKKEEILRGQAKLGLQLPEGRTASEKALIAKVKATTKPLTEMPFGRPALPPEKLRKLDAQTAKIMKEKKGPSDECICDLLTPESERKPFVIKPYKIPSEKLRKAKAAGLLTPLEGKSKEQKEKILKGLAMQGIPLPEAKTASEQKLMDRVRAEVGLPPEPKTPSAKEKYNRAMAAGLITPLEGKSIGKKERILRDQAKMGLPLPEGRTPSEKALIARIKETTRPESVVRVPSEKLRKARAAGLLTPLQGKSREQKQKILRGLAMQGIPLPEAKTASEQKLMDQVRAEVGLPPEPKTPSAKEKYNRAMAAGLITPLEGKSIGKKERILRDQAKMGLPLPEGRTPSEKALIARIKETTRPESVVRVPSEKLRKARAAGLLTPLQGKSREQKQKILRGLAMQGIPLPEAKTASEQKLMDQVRAEVGLPPEPKTPSAKEKYNRAMAAGLITPLEGKSIGKKERILRDQAKMGLPLPEGRTPSEKALITRIKETTQPESVVREPSEKLRKARAAGLLTPLQGKSREQKQKILRGLAMQGIPLPEAKTASEQKLMDQVRAEVGLPPEPKTPSAKEKYNRAMAAGLITPLEGKSIGKKERILRDQAKMGLPLPEGRTPSEKALIARIKETTRPESVVRVPSEKLRKARAAGLLTPLQGKSREQKQKILRGLAMQGIPLPEAKTASEQKLMDQVRAEVGLPPEPKTPSAKEKYNRAMAAGLITPLEGKSIGKKERILRDQAKMGLPLPEGRTPSEKALIARIKETTRPESVVRVPSEKLRKARAAGLLTPLQGKSREQKQKILRGLAMQGIPLPEAKTASEQKLMDQVRAEVGLPPEPKTPSAKEKYNRAMAAGLITPLEGKSIGKKERILRDQAKMGLPLPEGRTPSEKALIARIKETTRPESVVHVPSEKVRKAKAAGLLTPLEGKSKEQKENILRGLAMQGIPLPEAKTASDQKLMDRIRAEVGLPPEPKTTSAREKYKRAMSAGLITPLEGKSASKKEEILRGQAKLGLPLPEGRTASEKALIAKVKATTKPITEMPFGRPALPPEKLRKLDAQTAKIMKEKKGPSDECICDLLTPESERKPFAIKPYKIPSEKLRKAKAAGLLTPLEGKSKEQKEKILKGLAMQGIPLPEAKTASEQKLMDRVRVEVGLPPEPKTPSAKEKYNRAMAAGLITPLEGKSIGKKEEILRGQAKMGLPLPEGRTASEKALIAKIKETTSIASSVVPIPSEKLRKAKAAGLLTPLEGKSAEKKEKILSGLVEAGLPLPKGKTPSEKSLIRKIQTRYGIPPKARTASEREVIKKAKAEGLLTPIKGKTLAQKEKILKGLAEAGLPMPEGTTPSEKALIQKVRTKAGLPLEATPSEKRGKIRKKSKKIGVSKSKGGIVEEFEDITKTTTCDRGCGCDKKKIRFKHSYVKIRVTSPDISSLCPCPEECVPGVKGGVFTDNEGIKVTIGRVTGVPSFPSRELPKIKRTLAEGNTSQNLITCTPSTNNPTDETFTTNYYDSFQHIHNYNDIQRSYSKFALDSLPDISVAKAKSPECLEGFHKEDKIIFIKSFTSTYGKSHLLDNDIKEEFHNYSASTSSSIESFYLLKTDSSLSLATSYDTYSVISISITETSSCSDDFIQRDYLSSQYDRISKASENYSSTFYTNGSTVGATDVYSTTTYWSSKRVLFNSKKNFDREIFLLKAIQSESYQLKHLRNHRNQESFTKYDISSSSEILDTVGRMLSKGISYDSSSLIIIMPTSSDEYEANYNNNSLDYNESTIYIQLSENCTNWNPILQDLHKNEKPKKTCQKSRKADKSQRIFGTDTTEDRPCCCINMGENGLKTCSNGKEKKYENLISESVTPMILKDVVAQGVSHEAYKNTKYQKKYLQQSPMSMNPTLRLCKMPSSARPCGPTEHSIFINDNSCNKLSEPCRPDKAKNLLENSTKQSTCVSFDDHCKDTQEIRPKTALSNTSCNVCASAKLEESNKKLKNIEEKNCCPCSLGIHVKTFQENGEEELIMKNKKTRIKKNKNILCECPEETHPEFQFDKEDWIDETQVRKMKSDLTQTVSGFKLNVPRKIPEPEMSFEEILKFYAENAKRKYERNEYEHIKPQTKNNASAECKCPPAEDVVEEPPADSEEPFQGIKFHIGGKGSGSKGLTGILCFQLFEEASLKLAI